MQKKFYLIKCYIYNIFFKVLGFQIDLSDELLFLLTPN